MSESTLSKILDGKRAPGVDVATGVARMCKLDVAGVIAGDERPATHAQHAPITYAQQPLDALAAAIAYHGGSRWPALAVEATRALVDVGAFVGFGPVQMATVLDRMAEYCTGAGTKPA